MGHTDPKVTGDKLGELIRNIATPMVLTIAGVIGIAAIVKRDYVLALTLVGLTVIVMGFLMKDSPYESWGRDVLNTIFGVTSTIQLPWTGGRG